MDTMKACQETTKDGVKECGFLVGSKCMANRQHSFIVSADFIRRLKIVGCSSWSRYLDWEEKNGNFNQMQELQEHEMVENRRGSSGSIPEGRIGKTEDASPMRSLFESDTDRRGSAHNLRSPDCDIMRRTIVCFVCGVPAVMMGSDGIYLCADHQEKKKSGKSLGKMKDEAEGKV